MYTGASFYNVTTPKNDILANQKHDLYWRLSLQTGLDFADAAKAAQDAFNARMSGRVVTGTASGNNAKSPSQLGRKAPAAQLQSPEAASKPAGPILVEVSSMDSFGIDNCQYIEL